MPKFAPQSLQEFDVGEYYYLFLHNAKGSGLDSDHIPSVALLSCRPRLGTQDNADLNRDLPEAKDEGLTLDHKNQGYCIVIPHSLHAKGDTHGAQNKCAHKACECKDNYLNLGRTVRSEILTYIKDLEAQAILSLTALGAFRKLYKYNSKRYSRVATVETDTLLMDYLAKYWHPFKT